MKNKTLLLAISLFAFINGMAYSIESVDEHPSETLIFKLPDNSEENWKEITHHATKTAAVIERIPLNQTINKWSDLICIQYFDLSERDEKVRNDIQFILDNLKNEILSSSPDNRATWKIIEQTNKDAIYEKTSYIPDRNIRPQHEVSRVVLTNTGLHRAGVTKNGIMSSEEKQKWVKLLKENTSIASFQEAGKSKGLSLANNLQDFISIEPTFSNWTVINTFSFGNGYTSVAYIPPSQTGGYITECLEIVTMPNTQELSTAQFFDAEKRSIQDRCQSKVNIQVLQKSQKEIIYTYSHPKDHLQLNAVVRTFLTDRGYYTISYKRGLEGLMEKEESLKWKEKLQLIQVKSKNQ